MVHLTGDTHGIFDRVEEFCYGYDTEPDDILVILGDAGINYFGWREDRELKEQLAELPITLLCIHGNHEIRPENIYTYEETERFGGIVWHEPDFPNLLFAKDGEIYELAGRRCIAIGGAYSIDKYMRTKNVDWWPDEQPSDETKDLVEERLEAEGWRVDVVLSHTCPYDYMPREAFLSEFNQEYVDDSTELWLGQIEQRLDYDAWYCGHFHTDKLDRKVWFLQDDFRELC
ncbi:MAG: metallophosphoesterase [Clostridiales bacterium]|nr:metallophosphoesterase [Clostridiales bacterium]